LVSSRTVRTIVTTGLSVAIGELYKLVVLFANPIAQRRCASRRKQRTRSRRNDANFAQHFTNIGAGYFFHFNA
jgi:hypothetical protein